MNKDTSPTPVFIPMLYIRDVNAGMKFYQNTFLAKARWNIAHEGRIHVAEMEIEGTLLRLHEERNAIDPSEPNSPSRPWIEIHLLVQDPDAIMQRAMAYGAELISPMKDHDYGFRQGNFRDPFGFQWCLERKDDLCKIPKLPDDKN